MQLSQTQRIFLPRYKRFRFVPPTKRQLFADLLINLSSALMLFAAGFATIIAIEQYWAAAFLAGMAVGVLAFEGGRNATSVHLWPVISAILDWRKLDELLEKDEYDDPQTT